jgi:hypothetical protein
VLLPRGFTVIAVFAFIWGFGGAVIAVFAFFRGFDDAVSVFVVLFLLFLLFFGVLVDGRPSLPPHLSSPTLLVGVPRWTFGPDACGVRGVTRLG